MRLAIRPLFSAVTVVAVVAVVGGCAAEASPIGPAAEEELRELSLTITGESPEVRDAPALKAGAAGPLACTERFEAEGAVRLGCARDKERLEVIVRGDQAVVVHRPEGRARDARTFFVCASSGNGPGDLPARLRCKSKAPTSRPGGLSSPFAATAPGFSIPNAHPVGPTGLVFRGMAPRDDAEYGELFATGVGAALIFKNATGGEVDEERAELTARGLPADRVVDVPFKWKGLTSFREPCEQTVAALSFLEANVSASRKTFFHCTVGEDRTGLLAAVHRLLHEDGLDPARAFDLEMCERGYGAGNPLKPGFVVGQVESNLTPLYQKLAFLVRTGKLSAASLDPAACAADPETDPGFAAASVPRERLRCGTSTAFMP